MRSRIRVNDKWYRPVKWLAEAECDGCSFDGRDCINGDSGKFTGLCDDGMEFSGMIFIPNTKEALAEYVVKRLEGNDDEVG